LRGDAIVSWFKPLDASLDDPNAADDQVYFMVVNAMAGSDGTAADYRQRIVINFENTVTPSLQRLNPDTGEVETVDLPVINPQGRRRLTLELDGGAGELFKFNTGDPFIGVEPSADFDVDGDVDGADFLRWQRGVGAAGGASFGQGDANLDLKVDGPDLNFWKSQLGSATPVLAPVPEPAAWLLMSGSLLAVRRIFARP
jgi:hypothetical protein